MDILSFNKTLFILSFILIYSIYDYYRLLRKKQFKKNNLYILIIARSTLLIIIILLLGNPIFTINNYVIREIPVVIDNSMSMKINLKKSNYEINKIYSSLNKWSDNNNFNLKYYIFGEDFKDISGVNEIDFSHEFTNFNDMFSNINSDIILITDGLINSGSIKIPKIYNKINIIGIGKNDNDYSDIGLELINQKFANDSLNITLSISGNVTNDLYNKNIYISNSKNNRLMIDKYNFYSKIGQITKEITISNDLLSTHNIIYIDDYPFEKNVKNNSVLYNIDDNKMLSKNILLLSGALSPNSKYIKNNILSNLYDYELNHVFRLNDVLWNENINDINFDKYNLLVLDNFPFNPLDNNIIKKIIDYNFDKILYFYGPANKMYENAILDICQCSYIEESNEVIDRTDFIKYKDIDYFISPNLGLYPLKCNNSVFSTVDGNSVIVDCDNISLFLIPNLMEIDYYNLYNGNTINGFIEKYIDDLIYNQSKYIDIYTNRNNYSSDDTIKVYFKINSGIDDHGKFIDILNPNNNIVNRILSNKIVDENLFLFEFAIDEPGKYLLNGFIENNKNIHSSNSLPININTVNPEISEVYLNEELLKLISRKSNGIYNKYDKLNAFLDNVDFKTNVDLKSEKKNIISYWYLLFILIGIISFEWYYRNKFGLV